MNSTAIVGYAYRGALYCVGHSEIISTREEASPVFASDVQPGDFCHPCHGDCMRNRWPLQWCALPGADIHYAHLPATFTPSFDEPDRTTA